MKYLLSFLIFQLFTVTLLVAVIALQAQSRQVKSVIITDQVTLEAGWKLISLDVIPNPDTPEAVFASLISANTPEIVTGYEKGGLNFDPDQLPFLNSGSRSFGFSVRYLRA